MAGPFRWVWALVKEIDRGLEEVRDPRWRGGLPVGDLGTVVWEAEADSRRGEDGGMAVRFELPGVEPENMEVGVRTVEVLTVTGVGERGVFCGSVALPGRLAAGSLRAATSGDVLWVTAPGTDHASESYPARIPVERV